MDLQFFSKKVLSLVQVRNKNSEIKSNFIDMEAELEKRKYLLQAAFSENKPFYLSVLELPRRDFPDSEIPILNKNCFSWFATKGVHPEKLKIEYDEQGELWTFEKIN